LLLDDDEGLALLLLLDRLLIDEVLLELELMLTLLLELELDDGQMHCKAATRSQNC